ncbi:MAG: hypothetical protein R3F34_06910 [Planctomycetota bacterium]
MLRLVVEGPCRVYGLLDKGLVRAGNDGDLVLVDPTRRGELEAEWLESRSPCNPFVGTALAGLPVATVVRCGDVVWKDGDVAGAPIGRPAEFAETSPRSG